MSFAPGLETIGAHLVEHDRVLELVKKTTNSAKIAALVKEPDFF